MKSADRPTEALEGVAKIENVARLTELDKQLNSPKSTIHRVLSTPKTARLVDQNRKDKTYHH